MSAKKKINIIDFNTIIEEEEKEKEQKNTKELNARQKLEEAKDHALDEFDSFSEDCNKFMSHIEKYDSIRILNCSRIIRDCFDVILNSMKITIENDEEIKGYLGEAYSEGRKDFYKKMLSAIQSNKNNNKN